MAISSSERSSTGIASAFRQHVVMLIRIFSHESHQEQTPVPTHWHNFEPSAATVGPHLSALPTVQSVVKEYAAPSFTLTAFSTTQGCVSSLHCTWLCRLSRTFQRSRSIEHYHSHRLHIWWLVGFFLTCFYAVFFIYIRPNVHVYYIYMYIIIYTVFPCLQDLARLKIALYILAHVPKSLLDPGL